MGKPSGKKSAYTFFVQDEKATWQEANPGAKIVFGDFMRECGAKWKTLDADTKAPFQQLADQDKQRYDAEMEDYEPEGGHVKTAKKRKTKVLVYFLSCLVYTLFRIPTLQNDHRLLSFSTLVISGLKSRKAYQMGLPSAKSQKNLASDGMQSMPTKRKRTKREPKQTRLSTRKTWRLINKVNYFVITTYTNLLLRHMEKGKN